MANTSSDEKFSSAFAHSPLALAVTAADGRYVDVNEGFESLTGFTREEVLGRTPEGVGLSVQLPGRAERLARVHAGERVPNAEARIRGKSGAEHVVIVSSTLVEIAGESCVLSSILDITERMRAEERYRAIVESQVEMLCRFRPDGTILFVNGAYARARGTTPTALVGVNFWDFIDDEDRPGVRAALAHLRPATPEVRIENRFETAEGVRWTLWTNRGLGFDPEGRATEVQSSGIDITDRKRVEEALRDANRIKDEFLATLSHELRTPLNAVLGWAQMLRTGTLGPEVARRALDSLERNAKVQMQLVDGLLDMSRIVSGKLQLKRDTVSLATVISGAVETVRPAAAGKRVALRVRADPAVRLHVRGDTDRLHQIVWNLLSNAVKFTSTGGRVDVALERGESWAEIVIRDTGEGIDPGFLPYVFDRFRQADGTTTRRHGGLGLGLAIVRHLAEAHGGSARAESDGIGKGATFIIRLPLVARVRRRPSVAARSHRRVPAVLEGTRILVVDDEADARDLLSVILESQGAAVTAVGSAGEALRTLERRRFDLLIADLGMPGQDGLSFMRAVRGSRSARIPAIAVTAYAAERERDLALEAGYDRHLAKPVEPARLVATVAGALRARAPARAGRATGSTRPRTRRRPRRAGSRSSRPKK